MAKPIQIVDSKDPKVLELVNKIIDVVPQITSHRECMIVIVALEVALHCFRAEFTAQGGEMVSEVKLADGVTTVPSAEKGIC